MFCNFCGTEEGVEPLSVDVLPRTYVCPLCRETLKTDQYREMFKRLTKKRR